MAPPRERKWIEAADGWQQAFLTVEKGDEIKCWFNPKEYSIAKSNNWEIKPVVGAGLPTAQFGGGNARELKLNLLFDDSDDRNGDVRDVTNKLFDLMEVEEKFASNKNKGRPPTVEFRWGNTMTFKAVIKSLSVQYTLFRPNGTPIRAQAELSLVQVKEAVGKGKKGQNPTTRGMAGLSSHVVRDGDSLQSIAYASYGDPTFWRLIAEANGIDDPLRLRRGTALSIPRISE